MNASVIPAEATPALLISTSIRLARARIGVAPVRLLSVRRGVTGRRMDDGEVSHDADLYIMRPQILDRHRLRGLLKGPILLSNLAC